MRAWAECICKPRAGAGRASDAETGVGTWPDFTGIGRGTGDVAVARKEMAV